MRSFKTTVVCLSLALAAVSGPALAAEIKVGTGETAMATVLQPVLSPFEKGTGIKVNYLKIGSGRAFLELVKNGVEAITSDASLAELIAKAKKEGVDAGDPGQFQVVSLARFKITAIVHKDNAVSALSKEQLHAIFSGKASNWKEFGGADAPIIIVWNQFSEGANYLFAKTVLDTTPVAEQRMNVGRNEEVRETVGLTPEAIGILPAAMLDPSVKRLEMPDISKEILMVTKGKPSPGVQKLIDLILREGSKQPKS
jgi:phosphate transport system substrate-binding protein